MFRKNFKDHGFESHDEQEFLKFRKVGYVDVSYPSNYDLFKNFTMDGGTGWLIGKYPGAEIIASDYQSDTWR